MVKVIPRGLPPSSHPQAANTALWGSLSPCGDTEAQATGLQTWWHFSHLALSQNPPCTGSQAGWQGTAPRFSKPCSASVWGQAAHHGHDQSHGLVRDADVCLMSWPCACAQLAGCQQLQQELCFLQSSPNSFVTAWLCHSWQCRNFFVDVVSSQEHSLLFWRPGYQRAARPSPGWLGSHRAAYRKPTCL